MVAKKYQRGQAIAEMAVGLVGIMAIFLGLLFISALGIENIKVLLTARGRADESSAAGGYLGCSSGDSILEWNYGNDELFFTADDSYTTGDGASSSYISGELVSTDGGFNLDDSLEGVTYVQYNFANEIPEANLFSVCADLTSWEAQEEDPLGKHELGDLVSAFRYLIHDEPDFSLDETVYMPRMTD